MKSSEAVTSKSFSKINNLNHSRTIGNRFDFSAICAAIRKDRRLQRADFDDFIPSLEADQPALHEHNASV
jgi:hypothetical protein